MELTSSRQEHHVLPRTQQKLPRKAEKEGRSCVSFYILSPSCQIKSLSFYEVGQNFLLKSLLSLQVVKH